MRGIQLLAVLLCTIDQATSSSPVPKSTVKAAAQPHVTPARPATAENSAAAIQVPTNETATITNAGKAGGYFVIEELEREALPLFRKLLINLGILNQIGSQPEQYLVRNKTATSAVVSSLAAKQNEIYQASDQLNSLWLSTVRGVRNGGNYEDIRRQFYVGANSIVQVVDGDLADIRGIVGQNGGCGICKGFVNLGKGAQGGLAVNQTETAPGTVTKADALAAPSNGTHFDNGGAIDEFGPFFYHDMASGANATTVPELQSQGELHACMSKCLSTELQSHVADHLVKVAGMLNSIGDASNPVTKHQNLPVETSALLNKTATNGTVSDLPIAAANITSQERPVGNMTVPELMNHQNISSTSPANSTLKTMVPEKLPPQAESKLPKKLSNLITQSKYYTSMLSQAVSDAATNTRQLLAGNPQELDKFQRKYGDTQRDLADLQRRTAEEVGHIQESLARGELRVVERYNEAVDRFMEALNKVAERIARLQEEVAADLHKLQEDN